MGRAGGTDAGATTGDDGPLTGLLLRDGRLGARLGAGGFGQVYVFDPADGPQLAVKVITVTAETRDRVRREIGLLAHVRHDHILRYLWHEHGQGAHRDEVFLATELCQGSLHDRLDGLSAAERVDRAWQVVPGLLRDTISGLRHLHQLAPAVIHRDIKPANLLESQEGLWRVADLGIVRELGAGRADVSDPTAIFTAAYLAPELIRTGRISPAVDWFSLGATVHWAFTGELVWPVLGHFELLGYMRHEGPTIAESLPSEWRPFVEAALTTDPSARLGYDFAQLISPGPGQGPVSATRRAGSFPGERAEPSSRVASRAADDRTEAFPGHWEPPPAARRHASQETTARSQPKSTLARSAATFLVVLVVAALWIVVVSKSPR